MSDIFRKMHDVFRDGNAKMERDKAETQQASELERDSGFFDVQWGLFKDKPALPLKTILPLSAGLNPSHRCAKIEWAEKYGDKATGKAAELLAEMLRRHGVLIEYLDIEHPEIPVVKKGQTHLDGMVWPSAFVAFARKREWSLPKGFPALPDMPGSEAIKTQPAKEQAKSGGEPDTQLPANWKLEIQAEAAQLFTKWRAKGCKPTKNAIKKDLAKWCKENNVKTDGRIYPDEEYIYRHVLRNWTPPD